MDLLDLVSSDANIQSRLSDMSPSSLIRQWKFSDVKDMFEEAKLSFTNFYSSRKVKRFGWLFIYPRFSIFFNSDFPSQIWLYITSQKKPRQCSTIAAERVFGMFLASCIQMSLTTWRGKITFLWSSHKIGVKKKTLLTIFWLFPSFEHWSVFFPFQRFSGPFLVIFQTQLRT